MTPGGVRRAVAPEQGGDLGELARRDHGSARFTQDIDVVYRRTSANIEKLVAALRPYAPSLRGAPAGLPFVFDAQTVRNGLNFTLTTDLGDLDLLGAARGAAGLMQWARGGVRFNACGRRGR